MEQLPNGYTLNIPKDQFPLSTDSMLLSGFVKLPRQAQVLDLGAGCGTLGLLLCAKDPGCTVTGLEISEAAHRAAEENIAANNLFHRMSSICGDIRQARRLLKPGTFDVCVSNPPYFSGGPASPSLASARKDDLCNTTELFSAAGWALRYGGDFFLVHRPEKLAFLCSEASKVRLEPKRLCLIRHKPDAPVSLILLQCRKGGKPGLAWEEICLFDELDNPGAHYRNLYHI